MKIPIWKQFTTQIVPGSFFYRLWLSYEDTNLKAIHNEFVNIFEKYKAVIIIWRYQFESNSQHSNGWKKLFLAVIIIWRYQFESNSQLKKTSADTSDSCDYHMKIPIWKQFTTLLTHDNLLVQLWLSYEDTNLKAIHNHANHITINPVAVIIIWRYQFESNSQQGVQKV